jgi:hypothetical protein
MVEDYTWKVTLADNSVKEEAKGDKFNLAWEAAGSVKKIELIGKVPSKIMSCNLETGEFNVNDELITPSGSSGSKKLYFRKRRQVRTDGQNLLDTRTKYMIGYTVNGKEFLASIQPPMGMVAEEILKPGVVPKSFRAELIALPVIGVKIADKILQLADSKEKLSKIPRETLVKQFHKDAVIVLDKYLGR